MAADTTTSGRLTRASWSRIRRTSSPSDSAAARAQAPGTFGTLAGGGALLAAALVLPPLVIAFLAIPLFFLGVWACDGTGRDLGVAGPRRDGVGRDRRVPAARRGRSAAWWLQAIAFLLFACSTSGSRIPITLLERT
jgi:hypothetical protein